MKLIECYIESFGKLSRFSYRFEDGMNIFCRENGWGKSTFAGFIKAMFYGLGTSRSNDANQNERLRYLPWQGGKCGGTLTFSVGEGTYRVERYFGTEKTQDTFALYDCKTGLATDAYTDALGEELFHIDASGYERSTYISEHLTADIRADYTGIQAKLVDMNDLFEYQVAEKVLTRRCDYYRTRDGHGAIADTAAAIDSRRAELAQAEAALQKTNQLNRRVRALDDERDALETRLRAVHTDLGASISLRTEEALQAHKESLTENLARTREAASACHAYLSARIPTPQELEEQSAGYRMLKETNLPTLSDNKLPVWVPVCLFIAGVGAVGGGMAMGMLLHPLYLLFTIVGLTFLGLGVAFSFLRHRARETARMIGASRAEYDRIKASLAAFLSNYPIVMADPHLHDDGERLWAIRAKIDELRTAMRAVEDATAAYNDFRRLHPELFTDVPQAENEDLTRAKSESEALTAEIDRVRDARASCEREIAQCAAAAGSYSSLSQELARLEEQKRTQEKNLDILRLTLQFLTSARNEMTSRYLDDIQEHFRTYMRILTEVDRDSVFSDEYSAETYTVTPDFCVNMTKYGQERSSSTLSRGGRDLVALCLRFAITDALFEGEKPPMILDDPFINLDDSKIGAAMALLKRVAEERQIFYVSCHSSRA